MHAYTHMHTNVLNISTVLYQKLKTIYQVFWSFMTHELSSASFFVWEEGTSHTNFLVLNTHNTHLSKCCVVTFLYILWCTYLASTAQVATNPYLAVYLYLPKVSGCRRNVFPPICFMEIL